MKKIHSIVALPALLALSVGLLSGCSKKNDVNCLNIVCLDKGYGQEWIQEAVKIWKAQNPDKDVDLNLTASADSTFEGNIRESDNYDDIYISTGLGWREVAEYLLPLDDLIEEEVDGVKIKDKVSVEYRNSLYLTNHSGEQHAYRLPWTAGVGGILYNNYLFDKYGWSVPTTFDELKALCTQIIAENRPVPGSKNKKVKPFIYTGDNTDYFDYAVYTWWAQLAGVDAINEFKQYTRNSKNNFNVANVPGVGETYSKLKDATGLWYELFGHDSDLGANIAAASDMQANNIDAQTRFMNGEGAMMFNGEWCYNEIFNYAGELPAEFQLCMMATPLARGADPANAGCSYTIGEDQFVVIPKSTIKPDLAKSFLKVLASDEMVKVFANKAHGFLGFDLSTGPFNVGEFSDPFVKSIIEYKNNHTKRFTDFSNSPLYLNNKVDFWTHKRPFIELINGTEDVNKAFETIWNNVNGNWDTWCNSVNI